MQTLAGTLAQSLKPITSIPGDLRPGDILLYGDAGLVDKLIEWKEGDTDTAHVEIYIGAGLTFASRNGIGVNTYQFTPDGLTHVRRPVARFDLNEVMVWIPSVKGVPYGFGDIKADLNISEQPEDGIVSAETLFKTGADCSHIAAIAMAVGSCPQFDPAYDWRKVTPANFKLTLASYPVYDRARALAGQQVQLQQCVPDPKALEETKPDAAEPEAETPGSGPVQTTTAHTL